MVARVSNASGVKFSLIQWDNDRMKIKHAKTKMDKDGKNAFPMAIMANRYEFYICPVLAMAVYMSCKGVESGGFPAGGDQLFPSNSDDASAVSKLYGTRMHTFLNRTDIKEELGEFAEMLKGSYGTRKGATNHGATAGLVANVLIAVLLRGQWDIGDTLKRYFKEHQAGDALVGRVLAGLDMHDVNFAALPPHFPKVTRQIDVLAQAQFANNPLGRDSANDNNNDNNNGGGVD